MIIKIEFCVMIDLIDLKVVLFVFGEVVFGNIIMFIQINFDFKDNGYIFVFGKMWDMGCQSDDGLIGGVV